MTRRPAVTLIEVLVSMFIMAIGMLALLVLFPLGAISMGQALKDDRCASTASMGENVAIAMNVRHDPTVVAGFATSSVVYVDPYGVIETLPPVGGVIPRVTTLFATTPPTQAKQLADRWFSLPDDIAFAQNGTPDTVTTGGTVDRGRRYSYAYLLSRPQPLQDNLVNLNVVVYSSRPVGALSLETTLSAATGYPVSGAANTNFVTVQNALASQLTGVKIGGWILDPSGYFYRVTNISDNGANATVLEVTPNLKANVAAIVLMDYVAEVFDKGTSWQP
jgi:hypothetical protein